MSTSATLSQKTKGTFQYLGTAQLVRDRQKIEELWNPLFKAWFQRLGQNQT